MANFDEVTDPEAKERLQNMQSVIESLETEEDPRAKKIRKLLEVEDDPDFREVLEDKLASYENQSTVSVEEAQKMVKDLGLDLIEVLQAGVMKKRDSLKASRKPKKVSE